MPNINVKDLNSQPIPFFIRYLEGQEMELPAEELNAVYGGLQTVDGKPVQLPEPIGYTRPFMTNAYPSDREDLDLSPVKDEENGYTLPVFGIK